MAFRRLYIWVEGPDDRRFIERILKPRLQKYYDWIDIVEYAGMPDAKMDSYLHAIERIGDSVGILTDYLFMVDMDGAPCISGKRSAVVARYKRVLFQKVFVVVDEIESWYISGLSEANAAKFKLPTRGNADDFTKEHLLAVCNGLRQTPLEVRIEILKCFVWETALDRSASFRYFCEKNGLVIV